MIIKYLMHFQIIETELKIVITFEYKLLLNHEITGLIFISLLCVRVIYSLTLSDENDELFMYLGRAWHYMEAYYVHIEIICLIWITNYFSVYLYVIHSPDKQYKWLELFAFLGGIIPHKRIGKSNFVLLIFCFNFFAKNLITIIFYL
jgi:hypothetical protein